MIITITLLVLGTVEGCETYLNVPFHRTTTCDIGSSAHIHTNKCTYTHAYKYTYTCIEMYIHMHRNAHTHAYKYTYIALT